MPAFQKLCPICGNRHEINGQAYWISETTIEVSWRCTWLDKRARQQISKGEKGVLKSVTELEFSPRKI